TYAEVKGYTESEQVVGEALDRVIGEAEGRVMIATFASLISRIQQVINAAVKYNRKVAVVGRSMSNNVKMALNMGYLNAPGDTLITVREARQLPHNKVVIMATGSQGEPTSALVRIANGEHQDIEIVPGDTVVLSSSPIPGNETVVAKTIDNLFRQGAHVLYSRIALVHVHGHASQEELKMMLSMVKPKFFVPVHGEYRHLVKHTELAQSMGIPASNTFVLEDGDVLELNRDDGKVVDHVPAGHVYVDGQKLWEMNSDVLNERRRLARDGVVVVTLAINGKTGEALRRPQIDTLGYLEPAEEPELIDKVREFLSPELLEAQGIGVVELEQLGENISSAISGFLYKQTRRRPKVLTVIDEV
ncbi:MAG: ribonuclease J, partial [Ardenticatenaceae bacterium]